jgi:hypothetical protein
MPEVSTHGVELAVSVSGGAQVPEGVEQVHVPHEVGESRRPSWPW